MRTVGEIRRLRLRQLMTNEDLSIAEIGRRIGRSSRDSTLSQILHETPDSKTGKPRQMGDAQARKLESTFKKPRGWMDNDPAFDAWTPHDASALRMVAAEPAPAWGAHQVLDHLGRMLEAAPAERRQALATNLQAWALEGGAAHYVAALATLLTSTPDKQRATGT